MTTLASLTHCPGTAVFAGPVYDTPTACTRAAGHVGLHRGAGRLPDQPYRWATNQPVQRLLWGRWSAA